MFDIRAGKERMMMSEFVLYEMIYMVGDATPADGALEMPHRCRPRSPYVFTWQGVLNVGELKLTCDKKEDWNGAWFMPTVADRQPSGETEPMLFLDKASDAFKVNIRM